LPKVHFHVPTIFFRQKDRIQPSFFSAVQFRVILIGDSTVGKSSLLRNFTDGTFAEVSDPTVGVDFFARLLRVTDGTTVKLQLWDTAGQVKNRLT
jgi:small GTP-binding protein